MIFRVPFRSAFNDKISIAPKTQNIVLLVSLLGMFGCIVLQGMLVELGIVSFFVLEITPFIEAKILKRSLNMETLFMNWEMALKQVLGDAFLVFFAFLLLVFKRFLKAVNLICSGLQRLIEGKSFQKVKIFCGTKTFVFVFCGILGGLFFIKTFGLAILDFTYTDYLMVGGDLSQHYTGWAMFRNSSWHFPLGLMDNIVYPFKESIIYTDSIPLFAVFFKSFSLFLPSSFQYFGLFGIIIYFLQGAVSGLIVKRLCGSTSYAVLGSSFFILGTTMMQRIYTHTSLAAHFIILLCIYVCINKKNPRTQKQNILIWSILIFLSAGIHLYFVPMVIIFMIFYLLRDYLETKKIREGAVVFCFAIAVLLVTMFVFGAFYSHADIQAGGFGRASSNINALFNPQGTSRFLKDLPLATSVQYEGYGYLGIGILFAILFILGVQVKNTAKIALYLKDKKNLKTILPYFGVFIVFFLFALSPVLTFNSKIIFGYYLPFINNIYSIFRSTGRFIWPVMYIIICAVIYYIHKIYARKTAVLLLCLAAALQWIDLSNFFATKGLSFQNKTVYQNELSSLDLNLIAAQKKHIFFVEGTTNKLYSILDLAIKNRLTINDNYLARKNTAQIENNKNAEIALIRAGNADKDTIYIFESKGFAAEFASYLRLYETDGIVIGTSKYVK